MTTKQMISRPGVEKIMVWDIAVRLFHWFMVISFAGAMITQEMESLRLIHVAFGYTMAALVAFRVLWGFIGTRYARFTSFVPTFAQIKGYIASMFTSRPQHYLGHNPLGALSILAMLILTLLTGASGYAVYEGFGGEFLEEAHEMFANLMLAVVGVHVAGAVLSNLFHRDHSIRSMITGVKVVRSR
ncbi:MAG: cytochrome b [Burkholderiaceae bacterium]|nr:cytochrome b [Burkholderiaceae bacterium]